MPIKYLVASPGRSGSIFVSCIIAKSLNLQLIFGNWRKLTVDQPALLHSHEAKLQLDKDIAVIQVHRRDVFAQVISAIIAEEFNEWNGYNAIDKQPFVADINRFYDKYVWHKKWHQAFEHYTQYTNVQHVWFEDFIGNAEKLCNLLTIPKKADFPQSEKSPYNQNYILNIEQLKQEFDQLENDQNLQQCAVQEFNWDDLKLQ